MRFSMFLSDKQVADRYSVSRISIWRWQKQGHFPKPVSLSPGCTRWKLSDIEAWEASRTVSA